MVLRHGDQIIVITTDGRARESALRLARIGIDTVQRSGSTSPAPASSANTWAATQATSRNRPEPPKAPPAGRSPAFRRNDLQDFDRKRTGDNTGTAGRPTGPQHRGLDARRRVLARRGQDRGPDRPAQPTRANCTSALHGRSRATHAAVDMVTHLGAHPCGCRQASRGEGDRRACPEEVNASQSPGLLRHDVDHEAGEREVGSGPPRALGAVDHSRQVRRVLADRGGHDRGGYRIGSGRAGASSSAECTRCALRHRYRAPAPMVTRRNSTVNHWKYQCPPVGS